MPSTCAIATCTNRSDKTQNIIYHQFPKKSDIRKKWIISCKRADNSFNAENSRICSVHFQTSDYVRNLKAELLGYVPAKRTLHENAVPTLNLTKTSAVNCNEETSLGINYLSCSSSPNLEKTPRHDRFYKRNVKKRAIETFQDISPRKKKM